MRAAAAKRWLDTSPPDTISDLRAALAASVVGQDEAIEQIARAMCRFEAGLAGLDKPIASFLLLGPSGVGKTLTVEALAEALHGSRKAVLKVHCAELRGEHELARLKGSPPGYVGWKECVPIFHETRLREVRLRSEVAVVLLDEVEKAHPALWDLLLGMLDKGEVLLNDNTRTDFRRTLIFMTGNAGAREQADALSGGMGFQPAVNGDIGSYARRAADRLFLPEFLNRLTAVLTYRPLGREQLRAVCRSELRALAAQMAGLGEAPFQLAFDDRLVDSLAFDEADARSGARHVKRAIEKRVGDPLANVLAAGRLVGGERILACLNAGHVQFMRV